MTTLIRVEGHHIRGLSTTSFMKMPAIPIPSICCKQGGFSSCRVVVVVYSQLLTRGEKESNLNARVHNQ